MTPEWVDHGRRLSLYDAHLDALNDSVVFSLGAVPSVPAVGVLFDLAGALLLGPEVRRRPPAHAELRAAVMAYDEHFMGRLVHGSTYRAACDATHAHPQPERVVSLFAELVLGRLGLAPTVAHGLVRRALDRSPGAALGHADPSVLTALAQSYRTLAAAARRAPTLLDEADVLALENVDALGGAAQRLAMRQVVEASQALDRGLPRRLRRSRSAGPVASMSAAESTFPVGGYAAIGTRGGIESLVASELIYMERGARVDPFTVRWATGELLRYLRDEGVHLRPHRRVSIRLDPRLTDARVLDPGAPHQRLVHALAALVVAVQRVIHTLSQTDLAIEVVVPPPLAPEGALLGLVLRRWISGGTVRLAEHPELAADTVLDWTVEAADHPAFVVERDARFIDGEVEVIGWARALERTIERAL